MKRRPLTLLAVLLGVTFATLWYVTGPNPLPRAAMAGYEGSATHGEVLFWAGGCASCHSAAGATGDQRLQLGGGRRIATDFGTFLTPNISPDPKQGIGSWTLYDFANAMLRGIRKDGQNLYPAFPYSSYDKMTRQDVADLWAYLSGLPAVDTPNQPDELPFPLGFRRLVGVWNALFISPGWVVKKKLTPQEQRGRYLAEGLAHCGQCHTPRNGFGAMEVKRWLAGAPNPEGKGRIPDITPARLSWSEADIAAYLGTGLTPEYDSAGGQMAEVVQNLAHLPKSDLAAIAAYLKKVPPLK